MSKLRIGVVGAGHLGKIHARLLGQIPNVSLAAVADPSPAAHKQILMEHDVPVFSDFRKLVEQNIDAVVVATPTITHFEIASEFLSNEIHCLIEKPMTVCPDQAAELNRIAKENNCVLSVGHVEQFNPAIELARKQIGQAKFFQSARCSGYTFRSTDIGVVHDLMIHDIELVNSMVPGSLKSCFANGISVFGRHEDIAQARLEFDCGAVANLTASRCSFEPQRRMQIFGASGFADINLANMAVNSVSIPGWIKTREIDFEALGADQREFVKNNLFTDILPKTTTVPESANAILEEQKDWVSAITSGSKLRNSGENAMQAVQIAAAVLESIEQHSWNTQPAPFDEFSSVPPSQLLPTDAPLRKAA